MRKNSRRRPPAALTHLQTSLSAATTIAARMPILYRAATTGSPQAMIEANRMITEKAQAAAEGAMAAGSAWMSLWMRYASGTLDPSNFGNHALSIMNAALAPAQRACHANARRLGP